MSDILGGMRKKSLFSYAGLLIIILLSYLFPHRIWAFALPFYLLSVPAILNGTINLYFSVKQIFLAFSISAVILIPLRLAFPSFFTFKEITFSVLTVQFLAVAFPEEVFFRGFLQDVLRNDVKGVFLVSIMFAVAHIPALLFGGETSAPLTFLPSIIMGLLYMKTRNVLPPTIFHFLSNVVFSGFMI